MSKQEDGDLYHELDGLYGKLDKLLGRRGPDALTRHRGEASDFPVLTEVVEEAVPGRGLGAARSPSPESAASDALSLPAEAAPPQAESVPQEVPPEVMAAVEARLFGLLARQQQEVDEAVRRIVREELARAELARRDEN